MNNFKLHIAVAKYFYDLIDLTDTYFLSDYVVNELDGYVDHRTYVTMVMRLQHLEVACDNVGVDIHSISQDVAEGFLNSRK